MDRTFHPSMKPIWVASLFSAVAYAAGTWAVYRFGEELPRWLYFIPLVFALPPARMYFRRSLVSLRFHDGHLTLETGFFSRTRRTVDLVKIQDVTVRQSLGQRLIGTGDLVLESAGENGTLSVQNLDDPRPLADSIIAASRANMR